MVGSRRSLHLGNAAPIIAAIVKVLFMGVLT
jgi:hypothetical protein